jgi:uncharacterized MnhB-related membrane protein
MEIVINGLIALMIIALAGVSLFSKDMKQSILSLILFGIFMSLAYVRLNAIDVALTEAAVGSGVTGALFLKTYEILKKNEKSKNEKSKSEKLNKKKKKRGGK